MYKIIKLILDFLAKLSCRLGMCCGTKCSSECRTDNGLQEGSIIPKKEEKNPYKLTGKGKKPY